MDHTIRMTGEHSPFPPSGAPIWGRCPGALDAIRADRTPPNERTVQGDAAHWLAAECLSKGDDAPTRLGRKAPNGAPLDEEIVEGVQMYVDDVRTRVFDPGAIWVERRVEMPGIHPECWGTVDAALIDHSRLYLWDYKHGHSEIKVESNLQLIAYANGIVNELPHGAINEVAFTIVQPFCYTAEGPIRRWTAPVNGCLDAWWRLLHTSAHTSPRHCQTGPHCRRCPAIYRCQTRRSSDLDWLERCYARQDFSVPAGRDLAIELRYLEAFAPVLKTRIEAIRDELRNRIENGDTSTGVSLESKTGPLKWSGDVAETLFTLTCLGIDGRKAGCKTPRQVIQGFPASERKTLQDVFSKTNTTTRKQSIKLVDDGNTLAAKTFSNLKET